MQEQKVVNQYELYKEKWNAQENTHSTFNRLISRNEKLFVPETLLDQLLSAISECSNPTICEHLTDRFKFFVEIKSKDFFEKSEIQHLVKLVQETISKFFKSNLNLLCIVLYSKDRLSSSRARFIFPNVIVDAHMALLIHASVISLFYNTLEDKDSERLYTRSKISDVATLRKEPVMNKEKWYSTIPNNVYLKESMNAFVNVDTYERCSEKHNPKFPERCPKCCGAGFVRVAAGLQLLLVLDEKAEEDEETFQQVKVDNQLLQWTSLRTTKELTSEWSPPFDCPVVPLQHHSKGVRVMPYFELEKSQMKETTRRFFVEDKKVLNILLNEIRSIPHYKNAFLTCAMKIVQPSGSFFYKVHIGGSGSHYCKNKNCGQGGEHLDSNVYFEISSLNGIVQKCFSKEIVGGKPCSSFCNNKRKVSLSARTELGFITLGAPSGDFFHTLETYLLPLTAFEMQGNFSNSKRRRRF